MFAEEGRQTSKHRSRRGAKRSNCRRYNELKGPQVMRGWIFVRLHSYPCQHRKRHGRPYDEEHHGETRFAKSTRSRRPNSND